MTKAWYRIGRCDGAYKIFAFPSGPLRLKLSYLIGTMVGRVMGDRP